MDDKPIILLCTCPNKRSAKHIATLLVENRCAACVNILGGVESVYRWNNVTESTHEHLLLIKSMNSEYTNIEQLIVSHHPYELPEIISVPIQTGLDQYLIWIKENTSAIK